MLSRLFAPAKVRSVLFISLSNIGDVVLTFPVFDALCEAYPDALFSVIVSAKAKAFFEGNPRVKRVHILEKQTGIPSKVRWILELRRDKFDLVVDLRNSMLPFLTRSRRRTRPVFAGESVGHMRDKHLRRLQTVLKDIPLPQNRHALFWDKSEKLAVDGLLAGCARFVIVAPGAADDRKRWTDSGFVEVIRYLKDVRGLNVILVGDRKDAGIAGGILKSVPDGVVNLCGRTSLKELALVLSKARLAVVNDSGIMHLASYLNIPTVALFGPTDPLVYGPWGKKACVVRSASGRMSDLAMDDVLNAVKGMA
ncbi:MAG: glycosyltransferase family 9 protein [Candidatus Omnitrophica bacterium]|nr:glycosyltransferase family 9 protein [Candidatus Omnitrophota bacterium]